MATWMMTAQVELGGKPQPMSEGDVVLWCIVLIAVVIAGFGAIMFIKRRLRNVDESKGPDAGFSLSELRVMRDRGEITSEEYEVTRARVIEKVKGKFKEDEQRKRREAFGVEEAQILEEEVLGEPGEEKKPDERDEPAEGEEEDESGGNI